MATSQVQARLNLNFTGGENPGSSQPVWKGKNFAINLGVLIAFHLWILLIFRMGLRLGVEEAHLKSSENPDDNARIDEIQNELLRLRAMFRYSMFIFGLYLFIVVWRTRKAVRGRYAIPEECWCSDIICVWCCKCCTVTQFGRHTADYDKYASVCCNATGLPDEHPDIV